MKYRRFLRRRLRMLLVAVIVLAFVCYWLARPTMIGRQFVSALEAGDYARAESLVVDGARISGLSPLNDPASARDLLKPVGKRIRGEIRIDPPTLDDAIRGERRVVWTDREGRFSWTHCATVSPSGVKKLVVFVSSP